MLLALLLFTVFSADAQRITDSSEKERPMWLAVAPDSKHFTYYIGFSEASNISLGHKQATENVFKQISEERGITIESRSESQSYLRTSSRNKKIDETLLFEFSGTVTTNGEKVTISGLRQVAYYWEKVTDYKETTYRYWVLVRQPRHDAAIDLPIRKRYGASAALRSLICPGWGQLHKKEKAKGIVLLTGETLFVSGAVIGQLMYSRNHDQAFETQSLSQREVYLSNRDKWATVRNVLEIAAGAVYIYSFIDAISAQGEPRYSYKTNLDLKLYSDSQTTGVSFVCRF